MTLYSKGNSPKMFLDPVVRMLVENELNRYGLEEHERAELQAVRFYLISTAILMDITPPRGVGRGDMRMYNINIGPKGRGKA